MLKSLFPIAQLASAVLLAASALLSGCSLTGTGASSAASLQTSGNAMQGRVHGGEQPVVGATIQLYEVGASGYTSAAKPLITANVTTAADGSFSITNDYVCDTGSYVYITASGGNPGAGTNNALALMAALGPCSSLSSSTFIYIDEVTTVAGAYALSQFSGGTASGTPLNTQPGTSTSAPADNFATSATNIQGLANAMATASVLANTTTGTTPGNNTNANASVEYWTINTLADILAACINTNGSTSSGSACQTLFTNVTPSGGTAPADTLQAALDMALHPNPGSSAISALYGLVTAVPPYTPVADSASAVTDLTVGLTYTPVIPSTTTHVLTVPYGIAIDDVGNVWVTNEGSGFPVAEIDPTGNPVQAGSVAGIYSISNYNLAGTSTAITSNTTATIPYNLAIDTTGNVWVPDFGASNVFRITGSGGIAGGANGGGATCSGSSCGNSAATGYSISGSGGPSAAAPIAIAVDGNNNVYFTMSGSTAPTGACGSLSTANKAIGEFASGAYGTYVQGGYGGSNPYGMAIDAGTADFYTPSGGSPTTIPGSPFVWVLNEASGGTEDSSSHYGTIGQYYTTSASSSILPGCATTLGFTSSTEGAQTTKIADITVGGNSIRVMGNPYSIAFDHAGAAWIVNNNLNDANATIKYSLSKVVPNYGTAFTAAQASANFTFTNFNLGAAVSTLGSQFLALDGAGNVWVTGSSPAILEIANNNSSFLSPATGFLGTTYTPYGSSAKHRFSVVNTNRGVAVDGSGNVWIANGNSSSGSVTVVIGAATPVVTPLSLGIKNNALATKP